MACAQNIPGTQQGLDNLTAVLTAHIHVPKCMKSRLTEAQCLQESHATDGDSGPESTSDLLRSPSTTYMFMFVSGHNSDAIPTHDSILLGLFTGKARPRVGDAGPTSPSYPGANSDALSHPGPCRTSVRGSLCPWTSAYPRNSYRSCSWRAQTCPNRSPECPAAPPW